MENSEGPGYRAPRETRANPILERRFLLLQIRTKVLNVDLEETFHRWYPAFRTTSKATAA